MQVNRAAGVRCYRRHVPFRAAASGLAAAGMIAVGISGCSTASDTTPPAAPGPSGTVITSTTKVASAGVLGNQRRPDESCAAEPARLDPAPPPPVRHAAGETAVVADPQRIVVLADDELDALCALGLQARIVAAALPDGAETQPSYLGTVIHNVAAVGARSAPDLAGIAAAKPDLILGAQSLTADAPDIYASLAAIAPTVFTTASGARWQDDLRLVGVATGRREAAGELLDGFAAAARKAGEANDATHFQASIVQFTESAVRVWGAENFPASVLAAVGVDRPAAQRFSDKPYIEIPFGSDDFSAADGDIVYVSFTSAEAKDHAPEILTGAPWRKLSANRDNRVFVVNNEVWQTGQGIVAARGIVDDLRWLNAPIN